MAQSHMERNDDDDVQETGLWDEIEEYLSEQESFPKMRLVVRDHATDGSSPSLTVTHEVPPGTDEPFSSELIKAQDESSVAAADEPATLVMPSTELSYELRSDIDLIKERYIVGKVLGRDLVHPNGQRIARQGDRITRQLVRQSEEAGLLVELIEHMTFDSFED